MYNEAHARAEIAEQARARERSLRHLPTVHRSSTQRAPGFLHALLTRWFGPRPSTNDRHDTLVLAPIVAVEMSDGRRSRRS